MASVIVTRVLKNLGTNVLIFYGAVMNLDSSIVEAARIDGASGFKLFSKIKLPLLMPTVLMASIVTMIGSMRVFDTIKLMTEGGPEGSTWCSSITSIIRASRRSRRAMPPLSPSFCS